MHAVILGAGALGVYFGGRLLQAGHQVTFLVREKRAKQIKENGLKIHSIKGDYDIEDPKVVTNVEDIERIDFVFLSVKGYHLKGTVSSLKALVQKGAYILPVLNGIEHISILENELNHLQNEDDRIKRYPVIGGLSFIMATLDEQGHVHHSSDQHKLVFGPLHEEQKAFCKELEEALQDVHIDSERSENILLQLWDKYMFITAFSGVTTTVNLSIGHIRKHSSTFDISVQVLREMKLLANKQGVELNGEHVNQAVSRMKSLPFDGTSSMHQDKRKGLVLELDHLQGGAIRLAEKSGIKVPMIEFIYHVNKPFESGEPI